MGASPKKSFNKKPHDVEVLFSSKIKVRVVGRNQMEVKSLVKENLKVTNWAIHVEDNNTMKVKVIKDISFDKDFQLKIMKINRS